MARPIGCRQQEDEQGKPVTRMLPRALMVPPGIPDFLGRARGRRAGPRALEGRAWSGGAAVARVEVSRPTAARRGRRGARRRARSLGVARLAVRWEAAPGEHELCCRARDAAGNVQPLEPAWNLGGYVNNAVQRVAVTVSG